jgi:hypothetical protein
MRLVAMKYVFKIQFHVHKFQKQTVNTRQRERERERERKDSRRVEVKRKHLAESERRFISDGWKKEHVVRRYPGNARSSF